MYGVFDERLIPGVNVTTVKVGSYVIVPGIELFPCFKVKVKVVGFNPLLKVIETALLVGTPTAPFLGFVETTVGWMVSSCPVVKVQV